MLQEIQSLFKLLLTIFIILKLGCIGGCLFIFALFYSYRLLMKYLFGLEMLMTVDKRFVGRNQRERLNILVLLTFSNFNAEQMRRVLIERAVSKIPKLRQRVVYTIGNYFWKKVPIEECENRVSIVDDVIIRDDEEALSYANEEYNKQIITLEELPYEIKIIPYTDNDDRGIVIFKFDHCMSDGLGMVSLICSIADNYSPEVFPAIMRNYTYKWYHQVLDWLSFIIYGPIAISNMLKTHKDPSPFRKLDVTSGNSKCLISRPFDLDALSGVRKELKITFNDLMMSVLSKVVRRYCDNPKYKGEYEELSAVEIVFPAGRKNVPAKPEDVQIDNQAFAVTVSIPLISDIRRDHPLVVNNLQKTLKKSGYVMAVNLLATLTLEFVPESLQEPLVENFHRKLDLVYSNLPGPTCPLYYEGCKLEMITPMVTTQRFKYFLPIFSFNKTFRVILSIDTESDVDGKEFIQYFEEELELLIR